MIENTFAIEPPRSILFRPPPFNVLLEYSLDHLDLLWVAEPQDYMIGLQVPLLAAL